MNEKKPEGSPQKRSLKLAPALGDWTTYKPPRSLIKRVKSGVYGFDRLSKEETEKAHFIHYKFGEYLFEALKNDLSCRSEFYLIDAYQNNYSSFLANLSQSMLAGRIKLGEYNEEVFFSIDLSLADAIINCSLGSAEGAGANRPLTEAENNIFETAFSEYLRLYNESFSNQFKELKFNLFASSETFQNFSPNSSFVYFIIEANLNNSYGKIILGYSGRLLKSILKKIMETSQPGPLKINRLPERLLASVSPPLSITLGKTEITSKDLHSLEPGDVLSLDQSLYSALPIFLDDKKIVLGQPGIYNGKSAIKIISVEKDSVRGGSVKVAPPEIVEEKEEEPSEEDLSSEVLTEEEEYPEEDFSEDELEEEEDLGEEEISDEFKNEEELKEDDNDFSEEEFTDEDSSSEAQSAEEEEDIGEDKEEK